MLIIYPCVQVSEVSTSDLEALSKDFEQWLWWRGKPSASRTWQARLKRGDWMLALSSQTWSGSLGESFLDSWTSFLVASRVSPSAMPANATELKTSDTSGRTSETEFLFSEMESASSRTSTESPVQSHRDITPFSSMCSATWKKWVSLQRQDASQRKKLGRLISGNAGSYSGSKTLTAEGIPVSEIWPTPTTQEDIHQNMQLCPETGRRLPGSGKTSHSLNLQDSVTLKWPTPDVTVRPHEGNVRLLRRGVMEAGMSKNEADAMLGRDIAVAQGKLPAWPTPTTQDSENNGGPAQQNRNTRPLNAEVFHHLPEDSSTTGSHPGQLNPEFVEALMGFPLGWTDLGQWGTR